MKRSYMRVAVTGVLALAIVGSAHPAIAATSDDSASNEIADVSWVPGLTDTEQDTLTAIYGEEPTVDEQESYLDTFGSVPSEAEVAAYLEVVAPAQSESGPVALEESEGSDVGFAARGEANGKYFHDYFSSGKWITRDGVKSLSLQPKSSAIAERQPSWVVTRIRFSPSVNWSGAGYKHNVTLSMYKQYQCHVRYGFLKPPWNIEPSKKETAINAITCN